MTEYLTDPPLPPLPGEPGMRISPNTTARELVQILEDATKDRKRTGHDPNVQTEPGDNLFLALRAAKALEYYCRLSGDHYDILDEPMPPSALVGSDADDPDAVVHISDLIGDLLHLADVMGGYSFGIGGVGGSPALNLGNYLIESGRDRMR